MHRIDISIFHCFCKLPLSQWLNLTLISHLAIFKVKCLKQVLWEPLWVVNIAEPNSASTNHLLFLVDASSSPPVLHSHPGVQPALWTILIQNKNHPNSSPWLWSSLLLNSGETAFHIFTQIIQYNIYSLNFLV